MRKIELNSQYCNLCSRKPDGAVLTVQDNRFVLYRKGRRLNENLHIQEAEIQPLEKNMKQKPVQEDDGILYAHHFHNAALIVKTTEQRFYFLYVLNNDWVELFPGDAPGVLFLKSLFISNSQHYVIVRRTDELYYFYAVNLSVSRATLLNKEGYNAVQKISESAGSHPLVLKLQDTYGAWVFCLLTPERLIQIQLDERYCLEYLNNNIDRFIAGYVTEGPYLYRFVMVDSHTGDCAVQNEVYSAISYNQYDGGGLVCYWASRDLKSYAVYQYLDGKIMQLAPYARRNNPVKYGWSKIVLFSDNKKLLLVNTHTGRHFLVNKIKGYPNETILPIH